jgi:hypothetical protein
MNTRRFLIATLLLSGALTPTLAWAQTSDADKATARDLTIEGYKALEAKDYAAALDRFTRADTLYHAPSVILGLARAQVGLGKLVSAQELYNRAAHETLPSNASTASKKAVRDAEKERDALSPRIPFVVINVNGSDTPRVTLDGTEIRAAALGVKRPTDPGEHVVKASAAGFETCEVTVSLAEGKTESVTLELKPPQAVPAPVVVAHVVSKPPTMLASPPPEVIPAPRKATAPMPPPPDEVKRAGSTQKTSGFVAFGLAGTALLVGGVTGGLAVIKHSAIAKSCPGGRCSRTEMSTLQPEIDSYGAVSTVSTIGFIAGGVLAAAGVVLVVSAPRAKSALTAVTPFIGFGSFGATGSF